MTGRLTPVPLKPGLYQPNSSMQMTADGNYLSGDLEFSDGNYLFLVADATTPQLTYLPAEGNGRYGPRVEVLLQGLAPGGAVNLWRESGDQRFLVRGAVRRGGADSLVVTDSEVPFGRAVTYRVEMLNPDFTSAGFTPGTSVVLDRDVMGADWGKTFVHNVLEPSRALEYVFTDEALGALTQSTSGGVFAPDGAAYPVWVGGRSGALTGVNVAGSTYTLADYQILSGMFGTRATPKVPILVFRGPPELLLPPTFFAAITTRVPQPQNVAWGGGEWVRWAMVADEVAPPFPGLSEPGVTLADLAVLYPTLAEAAEVYPNLLDVARDYSLAGLAG